MQSLNRFFPFLKSRSLTHAPDRVGPDHEDLSSLDVLPAGVFSKLALPFSETSFFGFSGASFLFNKRECQLVRPHKAAAGLPWLWRARFWGHQPQVDLALLEQGFHVAYCDVVEMFGNDESVIIWDAFYNYMQELGLARKVSLHAMSRGSLYAYNWSLKNGDKVDCIYADNPILDIKSWPWNMGRGIGSKKDRRLFRKAFNFTCDEDVVAFKRNPIDLAGEIAALNVPILHVCSAADEFVPVEENTDIFEKRLHAAGGSISVIRKPGARHHPHGLEDPKPIIDFILHHTTAGKLV